MKSVWSAEDAESLLEMVSVIEILSCASGTTAKLFCDWAGEYQEEKLTYNYGSKSNGHSLSYETKKILQPVDLMKILSLGEAVLLMDGSYYRVNAEKARYYNIPKLKKKSEECKQQNSTRRKKTYGTRKIV